VIQGWTLYVVKLSFVSYTKSGGNLMKTLHMKTALIMVLAISLIGGFIVRAQEERQTELLKEQSKHVMVTPDELKWTDGPPSLPAGAKFAVLEGDIKNPGPFTMRLKLPANYKIPARSHPADEHVTVLSGTFNIGLGDNPTEGKALPAGSFALIPARTSYFASTQGETIVQLHGIGPWEVNPVNPVDNLSQ
jgi:quercetin dioxygenase-like cupin family protein